MLKFGHISEVDAAKGLAKVHFTQEEIVSSWLPMAMRNTGEDKYIQPFDINEHVYCIMDDQCENGVIAGAIYDSENLPDGGAAGKSRVKFADGLSIEYNRSTKTLAIEGEGQFKIDISGDATITCDSAVIESPTVDINASTEIKLTSPKVTCSGEVTANKLKAPEITEGVGPAAIRLGTHKHLGVTTGPGTSGTPTP